MTQQPSTTESTSDTTQDFLAFLAGINKGRAVRDCGDKLRELVAAVTETGKGGTLTVRITVKPAGKSGALTVVEEVGIKPPKLTPPESIFFADKDHNLVRNNPNQSELW